MVSLSKDAAKVVGLGIRGNANGTPFRGGGVCTLCDLLSNKSPRSCVLLLLDLEADSDKLTTSSRRLLRISSSREFVASFKLTKSVALSLLRRLRLAISFCKLVAMLVRLRIWLEIPSNVGGTRTSAVDPFVTFARDVSGSLAAMVCSANIVADGGGAFSPRMLCGGRRNDGLTCGIAELGVSRPVGVGVPARVTLSFSGDFGASKSLDRRGLDCLVGLLSGDRGVIGPDPFSRRLLISLTLPVCSDCILLCVALLTSDRSGDVSKLRSGGLIMYALSRAFSVSAACATLIAFDVFGFEMTLGEDGFIGNGGGARSGSELSHLEETIVLANCSL